MVLVEGVLHDFKTHPVSWECMSELRITVFGHDWFTMVPHS